MRLLVSWSCRSSNASATPATSSADWTTFCSEPATRSRRRASARCGRGGATAAACVSRCVAVVFVPACSLAGLPARCGRFIELDTRPADCACRSSFRKSPRTAAAAQARAAPISASSSAGVTTSSVNCWLLPARGSSERSKRSAALSDERQLAGPGCSSSARLPVDSSTSRVVELRRGLSSCGSPAGCCGERPRADWAAVDLVLEPRAVEAVVVGHLADERQHRVGRDRRADAGQPHGHLRHFVPHHGQRHAIRLARGHAVGIGHAHEQHIVVGQRAIFPAQLLLRSDRRNATSASCFVLRSVNRRGGERLGRRRRAARAACLRESACRRSPAAGAIRGAR